MTLLLAIDPGSVQSAVVLYDRAEHRVAYHGISPNDIVESYARRACDDVLVIEGMAPRGMPTSGDEMKAIFWSGRFAGAWGTTDWHLFLRRDVKLRLCGTSACKDSNVRQAVIDRFGGNGAIGLKKTPGPLYGIRKDEWQALALALAFCDEVTA